MARDHHPREATNLKAIQTPLHLPMVSHFYCDHANLTAPSRKNGEDSSASSPSASPAASPTPSHSDLHSSSNGRGAPPRPSGDLSASLGASAGRGGGRGSAFDGAGRGAPVGGGRGRGAPTDSSASSPGAVRTPASPGGIQRGVNRGTRRPGQNPGATRHEREMMAVKSSNQNLMRKQMNLLRAQIKKNGLELERMKARDAEKEGALTVSLSSSKKSSFFTVIRLLLRKNTKIRRQRWSQTKLRSLQRPRSKEKLMLLILRRRPKITWSKCGSENEKHKFR